MAGGDQRRPWLAALMEIEAHIAHVATAAFDQEQGVTSPSHARLGQEGAKSAKPLDASSIPWRVAMLRTQIPPHGPIGAVYLQPGAAPGQAVLSGRCTVCAGPLTPEEVARPWRRYALCVEALEVVLNACKSIEGVEGVKGVWPIAAQGNAGAET